MHSPFDRSHSFNVIIAAPGSHTDASRGSEYNYLALMHEGNSRIVCPTHEINMTAGEAFFIPRGCRYHSYWNGDDRVSWTTLGFSSFPEADVGYRLQKLTLTPEARDTLMYLGRYKKIDSTSLGLFYTLLSELLPHMEKEPPSPHQATVEAAEAFMRKYPKAPVAEVAKHCRVSSSGLFAAFRSQGKTPALTRQKLQIDAAMELISGTSLSADEIAERVGFASTSYFLRTLKKLTGKTTRELRKEKLSI